MDATRVSKDLFGRPCRLPLALWILRSNKERFYQSEPPRSIDAQSAITQELDRFVSVGLLDIERPDGENRVYYVRTDSPLWEIVRTAGEVIDRAGSH
jgi:hypothetical protein